MILGEAPGIKARGLPSGRMTRVKSGDPEHRGDERGQDSRRPSRT